MGLNMKKLKKWWWHIFPPYMMDIDEAVLRLSASDERNKKTTEKLAKEYSDKYFK